MNIAHRTALVSGANRGLGRHLAQALLARGARVYAGTRTPECLDLPGVTPLRLDITDQASIEDARAVAGDLTILINNAGISTGSSLLEGDLDLIRLEMDTHFYGTLAMARAFVPTIARNGGGAILNVLSALSWLSYPTTGAYSAAKSAEWSLTNALRLEAAPQNIVVSALHVGYMDTDMTRHIVAPKSDPAVVAALALEGIAAGQYEILADEVSRQVQANLARGVAALYPSLA